MSLAMTPSATNQGKQTTVTQRRRAAKEAAKAKEEIEGVEEATSKMAISGGQEIHDYKESHPSGSDVSSSEWERIKEQHESRTKAERALFANTKLLPRMARISDDPERMHNYNRLFGKKVPLLENSQERAKDEETRREAVADLMWAREAAGFEPMNEAMKWAHTGFDLMKELEAKVNSQSFRDIEERYRDRKAHRRFLEDNIEFLDERECGISEQQKHWLRTIINDLVCPPGDAKAEEDLQRTSIQVVYWVIVYREEAGFPLELTHSSPSIETIATHKWLMMQPLSFFESDSFHLRTYFDIGIEQIKKLTVGEKLLEVPELAAETIAQMDAELDAWFNDEQPKTTQPPTATGHAQISAHSHGVPTSEQGTRTGAVNFGDQLMNSGAGNARKRDRSSSPDYMDTSEEDGDGDFMHPEPISPVRTAKRRRSMSP